MVEGKLKANRLRAQSSKVTAQSIFRFFQKKP
ncbi:hypothetical protein LYNGBM3L_00170 [Moorena producens 3L]|uniref:Uncharacterized protein n=1 Tax=Moorena producens 3L TaxID=489825 RepID=F4XI32_9CYAN|nr:hypothetical protein LYNGBM3L_00170 [Moorena producens 3L]